jgi:hypothetical protein
MAHESLQRDDDIRLPSNRAFGFGGAIVFLTLGLLPLAWGSGVRVWGLDAAAVFVLTAFAMPRLLAPLNRAWMRLGLLMHRVVNPVVLGVIFYLAVLPTGLVLRLLRRSTLRNPYDANAASYWIPRTPPGPTPKSLERQF